MSDAINYLLKARPEAMQDYFGFLKKSGKNLDPKTRALISVITKVSSRTERGFHQYLTRALRTGCTPDEIIDALLAAFPILGLTGITWAVDLILELDLPEFQPEQLGVEPAWHTVADIEELEQGTTRMPCDNRELFIYRDGNTFKVYDSRCPHQVTNIPKLALQDCTLTCPKHEWQFDIRTGECIAKGDRPLNEFASKVENNQLLAYW